jgi:hypothetical protein
MTDELILEDGVVTPKNDFYLKLDAEASMPSVLSAFYKQDYSTIVDPETGVESTQIEGEPYFVSSTSNYAIDVVGTLSEPTGNTLTDDNDMEYPEIQALDGWHVNIRLVGDEVRAAVEALDTSHGVTPSAPQRIWL